jgi:hypothetical protein
LRWCRGGDDDCHGVHDGERLLQRARG